MRSMRPLLNHTHDDDQVEADPPLAQHGLCQPRAPWSNLGQTTRRCGHGGRPRCPAIPAARLPAPLPRSTTIPVGRSGRRNARTPDAGHWTPGRSDTRTGHWTPIVWTATVGHWTLSPDTDADRATTAQPAPGLLGLLAERPHAGTPNRVPDLSLPGSRWVAPLAGPRLGALLSSKWFGLSVRANGDASSVMTRSSVAQEAGRSSGAGRIARQEILRRA
jgi:hypothetical protein